MFINVGEIYPCIQGEGKYAGIPHILVRMIGCKLRCMFKNSICDTAYASWFPEKSKFTLGDIEKVYKQNPKIEYTMITGGGPTLNPEVLNTLVDLAQKYAHYTTIETEGSAYVETNAQFISLSPKLKSSTPIEGRSIIYKDNLHIVTKNEVDNHEKNRKNYDAMRQFINSVDCYPSYVKDYQVKFVVTDIENDIEEIENIQKELNIPNRKVSLMPEGTINSQLQLQRREIIEKCIEKGWNYSDRLHIIAYDDLKGV